MANCIMSKISALNVTVLYRVDGEVRVFSESVTSRLVIERYLKLESGETFGLFVPVGKGQQVNALNIEWFEIERVSASKE
ncbi:TPA: hypothetical protein JEL63_003401 [Salmonella enterica subsp. enterica serovar Enteritidis]|uniref:hypothetical protein n=1 Tax=Salmonella enterica TaxID=28901 RepID=UPI0002A683A1|nr:hypothetical protein [Salmonella enterica]EAO0106703.1 hypothetical protein [Salmonella enterica]ELO78623.1 hypothetical protein SEEERB17_010212 [Salmonella enterica subsp. enterica serovar Enteritidis str. SARB17]HAE4696953.1 hypothetical protein [Salmonella enterica subsp. enterica serovar Enteritidis]HAU6873972.1 hypothetical protein [Salmonella enterica subsp. enterica serovar Enteritidis]